MSDKLGMASVEAVVTAPGFEVEPSPDEVVEKVPAVAPLVQSDRTRAKADLATFLHQQGEKGFPRGPELVEAAKGLGLIDKGQQLGPLVAHNDQITRRGDKYYHIEFAPPPENLLGTWDDSLKEDAWAFFSLLVDEAGETGLEASVAQKKMREEGLWPDIGPKAGSIVRKFAVKVQKPDESGEVVDWYVSKEFAPQKTDVDVEAALDAAVDAAAEAVTEDAELEEIHVLKAQVEDLKAWFSDFEQEILGRLQKLEEENRRLRLFQEGGGSAFALLLKRVAALEEAQEKTSRTLERLILKATGSDSEEKVEVHVHIHKG